jgi:hypothetical protein
MVARLHQSYGKDMMMARAYIHSMRQFFSADSAAQALAPAEKRVKQAVAQHKEVKYIGGQQAYTKAAFNLAQQQKAEGKRKLPGRWQRVLVRKAGASWARLTLVQKQHYENEAQKLRLAQEAKQEEVLALAEQALEMEQERLGTVALERSLQLLLSQSRIAAEDRATLDRMLEKDARFTQAKVQEMREKLQKAPPPPILAVQAAMEAQEGRAPATRPLAAEWAKTVAHHRDLFADTALIVRKAEGGEGIFKLIFCPLGDAQLIAFLMHRTGNMFQLKPIDHGTLLIEKNRTILFAHQRHGIALNQNN